MQFTIGEETHARLRRVQTLLRREISDGDPGAIFDRALKLLETQIEKTKLGAAARPRRQGAIRPGTDKKEVYKSAPSSRHIPAEVKRAVCRRDGDQCAFVSEDGRRCTERTFLEFDPFGRDALEMAGPAVIDEVGELELAPHVEAAARATGKSPARPSSHSRWTPLPAAEWRSARGSGSRRGEPGRSTSLAVFPR